MNSTRLTKAADGSLSFSGRVGDWFFIPAPIAQTANGEDVTADSGIHYELGAGGTELTVAVDESWLASLPTCPVDGGEGVTLR